MPARAKFLFIVSMDVQPDKEVVFNDVYDTEHIPLILKVPGVLSARRCRCCGGSCRLSHPWRVDLTIDRQSGLLAA